MTRSSVSFLAWAPTAGRARDLAQSLDGEARLIFPTVLSGRRLTPLRYVVSAVLTSAHLVARRPRAVVVQNPPVYPALFALAYARVARARMVLDSHPTAFGAKGNIQAQRMLRVTRFLARHAAGVLVTTEGWAGVVRDWGGRPLVLHEAPPAWSVTPASPLSGRRPRVLFSCVFGSDEPVQAVIEAARALPQLDIVVTGDPRKAAVGVLDSLPSNVVLSGWLDQDAYAREVDTADIVLALTTEQSSVMRAAYEAGYAGRPLVMSDTPSMRQLFPEAITVGVDAVSIAEGLTRAVASYADLLDDLDRVRDRLHERWCHQRSGLLTLLGMDDLEPSSRSRSVGPGNVAAYPVSDHAAIPTKAAVQ